MIEAKGSRTTWNLELKLVIFDVLLHNVKEGDLIGFLAELEEVSGFSALLSSSISY